MYQNTELNRDNSGIVFFLSLINIRVKSIEN